MVLCKTWQGHCSMVWYGGVYHSILVMDIIYTHSLAALTLGRGLRFCPKFPFTPVSIMSLVVYFEWYH